MGAPETSEVCSCQHARIRHPYGGSCNRSGCGCTKYRDTTADVGGEAEPEIPEAEHPPLRIVSDEKERGELHISTPPMPPTDQNPEGSEPEPETPESPSIMDDLRTLRGGLDHADTRVRRRAETIRAQLRTVTDELAALAHTAELRAELERVEARRKEIREALGLKQPGRRPAGVGGGSDE